MFVTRVTLLLEHYGLLDLDLVVWALLLSNTRTHDLDLSSPRAQQTLLTLSLLKDELESSGVVKRLVDKE